MNTDKLFDQIFNRSNTINALLWIAVIIIFALPFGFETSLSLVLPLIIPVHLNYYFLDKFVKKQQYIKYGLLTALNIFAFGVVAQGVGVSSMYPRIIYIPNETFFTDDYMYSINAAFNPLIALILTTLFRFFKEKKDIQIIEKEKEKVNAELNMLKHQVNPHFLFNTLNNLFSMSSTFGDEATANGIGHLSHLMRYMLYDTNSEFVRLENEIEMLENFIDLQKLRIESDSHECITFNVTGDILNKHLPPMLLIPFLENAFKHGYSVNYNFFVKINLIIKDKKLNFELENSINKDRESKNMDSSGIGLGNVQKRLDLLYNDEYFLEIIEKNDVHFIKLVIPLKH